MTKIFKKYKICVLINLAISQISDSTIDDAIYQNIQAKYENKITKYGYIKENSIEIIKRSAGTAMKEHFNSSFQFKAVCYAYICNPSIDTILEAEIVSSNNAGFKAEVKDNDKVIIDIIIPRLTTGIKHEYDIEDITIGSNVYIKICRKRYHYNDNKIVIIGLVIKNPNNNNIEESDELVDTIVTTHNIEEPEELVDSDNDDDDDDDDDDDTDTDSIIGLSVDTDTKEPEPEPSIVDIETDDDIEYLEDDYDE